MVSCTHQSYTYTDTLGNMFILNKIVYIYLIDYSSIYGGFYIGQSNQS